MPTQNEIQTQLKRLLSYRRTLAHYLDRQAKLGMSHTPPEVTHGIIEAQQNIEEIKNVLRGWHVGVENHPDDQERDDELLRSLLSSTLPSRHPNDQRSNIDPRFAPWSNATVIILALAIIILVVVMAINTSALQNQLPLPYVQATDISRMSKVTTVTPVSKTTVVPQTTLTTISPADLTAMSPTTTTAAISPTEVSQVDLLAWKGFVEIWLGPAACDYPQTIPPDIHPESDPVAAFSQFYGDGTGTGTGPDAFGDALEPRNTAEVGPNREGDLKLSMDLTALKINKQTIILTNKIKVRVTRFEVSDKLNGFFSCQGFGLIRNFSPIYLRGDQLDSYETTIQYGQNDSYFYLKPEDVEQFGLEFICKSPGVYDVEFGVDYRYGGDSGKIDLERRVVCPKRYTIWTTTDFKAFSYPYTIVWDQSQEKYVHSP